MSRGRAPLSVVVDDVLAQANAVARRRDDEARVVKEAAAQPKTALARELRTLAVELRTQPVDVTYADLAGVL